MGYSRSRQSGQTGEQFQRKEHDLVTDTPLTATLFFDVELGCNMEQNFVFQQYVPTHFDAIFIL